MTDQFPEKFGKYKIIKEVGRGGFADVYKAVDTTLDRTVALKFLEPRLLREPTFVERFQREAKLAANLKHPSIVFIHEFGWEAGTIYIAMEFLEGRTLKEMILEEGALPSERIVKMVGRVASALDYAHGRGLVHRDIKPSNIMVGADDHVTVMDFGIAKAAALTALTTTGRIFGTPEYMSPEQAEGLEEPDARSDIYSLGVVVYEMITGKVPFSGTTPLSIMRGHADKPPPRPSEVNPDVPPAVETVLLKALAKKREERYQSAGEMARALKEATEVRVEVTRIPLEREIPVPPPVEKKPVPLVEPAAVGKEEPEPPTAPPVPKAVPKKALALGGGLAVVLIAAAVYFGRGPLGALLALSMPTSTPTPTPTSTPTSTPTPTPTPIPYDLTVSVVNAEGNPMAGATVVFPGSGDDEPVVVDGAGQVSWFNLPSGEVALTVSAQGYHDAKEAATIGRGSNHIAITLERAPYQLLPSEVCQPGQEVLYMEDFEDGQAQGWENVIRPAWSFGEVEGHGTVLTAYVPDGKAHAEYYHGDFGNSVWLLDLQAGGGNLHLNWHFTQSDAGISRYLVAYKPGEHLQIHRLISDVGGMLAWQPAAAVPEGVWKRIAIAYSEGAVDVWIDGQLMLDVDDPEPLERGGLSLEINPSPVSISFDNMVVCSLSGPYQP